MIRKRKPGGVESKEPDTNRKEESVLQKLITRSERKDAQDIHILRNCAFFFSQGLSTWYTEHCVPNGTKFNQLPFEQQFTLVLLATLEEATSYPPTEKAISKILYFVQNNPNFDPVFVQYLQDVYETVVKTTTGLVMLLKEPPEGQLPS